ncbi:Tetratricopeptide TPR1 [Phytophthora cinnamomi]|uniref:Tetratricopeptide TPR1 n=1 Tax=Phytophthora cinnamomi TaxID=4785 RepID=UPI00355A05E2|nr:Tetratricopeptide TPR1 [Phytophthora cinnamomi]
MLSSTVACLKQKNMDLEALGCLEQSLWLKRRMFGVDNSVVHKALNEVMLSYNSVAMQYLAQGQFDQCLAMLRKAEAITAPGNFKRCQALQILTFNNIGCCYRKLGKLKSALKYLKEAAQIGSGSAHVKNLSITHLNLCAIQSQLGRHDLALEHAQAAIFHTQEELVSLEDGAGNERDEDGECNVDDRDQAALVDALDPKTREEKIISLAVAYHNLAVELEFNGRGEASLQWYKKALQLVWKYRETNEALCESFKKIFLDARKKQQTANVRQNAAGGRLQAFFRGQRCRTEVNQLKQVKLENESATLIQHQTRQYLEMLQEEKRLEEERLQLELQKEEVEDMAACLIQRLFQQELVSVQQIAAITIQNFWKQYLTTRDHCLEEIEAATCIQALSRGHLTRKSLKSLHGSSSSGLSKHSSAFSMSSSAGKLAEEDESGSARKEKLLNVNYSFLPASIRELYVSSGGIQAPTTNTELHAEEIAELGLTFVDFLRELETCTDLVVCSSALDAMQIVVETAPESSKTLANVVKVAQILDRRLQEGFWNEAIEASSIALLQAFRDVLDAQ